MDTAKTPKRLQFGLPRPLKYVDTAMLLDELWHREVVRNITLRAVVDGRIAQSAKMSPEEVKRFERLKLIEMANAALIEEETVLMLTRSELEADDASDLPPGSYLVQLDGYFLDAVKLKEERDAEEESDHG